jgi:cytochrome c-type protein NapB
MNADRRAVARVFVSLVLIASAITAVVALGVAGRRLVVRRGAAQSIVAAAAPISPLMLVADADPISAEWGVFRTPLGTLAIDPTSGDRRPAHPRTLATFRLLRAYPSAPPRIPHGLTPDETRTGGCKTCHERGGYSQRFGAYVPVTPHPEMGMCLQCHVGDAQLMANPLPATDPNARCRQCHAPGVRRWRDSSLDWTPLPWPELPAKTGAPPPIPHSLQLRGNCLACHSAPSAVAEIRTPHPERSNCRQCHVEENVNAGEFTRPQSRTPASTGGRP